MELGLLRDILGNFFSRGERYYCCVEGNMQGAYKVRMPTQGENAHVRSILCGGGGQLDITPPKSPGMDMRCM